MEHLDYMYHFDAIMEKLSLAQIDDLGRNEQHCFHVAIDDKQLLLKRHHQMPAHVADLVDVAVSVYVADRLSIPKAGMPRRIHIVLPVRHPEIIDSSRVAACLQKILYWYTSDDWSFEFTLRNKYGRSAELQMCMPLIDNSDQPLEVALWSGGLDSLAGLYDQLLANPSMHYILFGTGTNSFIQSTQQKTANATEKLFPGRTTLV